MNKLILVGNGFDLAHGLPTSYQDFLNDFWKNIHLNYKNEDYKKIVFINEDYYRILNYKKQTECYQDFIENLSFYSMEYKEVHNLNNSNKWFINRSNRTILFEFRNSFFKIINEKLSIENWVDIENEYYSQLKKITQLQFGSVQDEVLQQARKKELIKLNKEFEELKDLFEKYLLSEVTGKFDFKNYENPIEWIKISEILKALIISNNPYIKDDILKLSKEFSFQKDEEEIKEYKEKLTSRTILEPIIFKSLILSFNYTPTVSYYNYYINKNNSFSQDIVSCNYIHGVLNSTENKINFGFGDEIDNSYKDIENIGDNEYLKNFKSFQYSNTQNYDDLLRYIDSEKFQVYILGHSCGLSDRVLLNTIFEHPNCRSIKVYYHENEKGTDNYTDIVQNISRHFDDKEIMRRKIVNKELCKPLPQNVRFKKIEKND